MKEALEFRPESPVSALEPEISVRARNVLQTLKCETIADVRRISCDDIVRMRFGGKKVAKELQEVMAQIGHPLRSIGLAHSKNPLEWLEELRYQRMKLDAAFEEANKLAWNGYDATRQKLSADQRFTAALQRLWGFKPELLERIGPVNATALALDVAAALLVTGIARNALPTAEATR